MALSNIRRAVMLMPVALLAACPRAAPVTKPTVLAGPKVVASAATPVQVQVQQKATREVQRKEDVPPAAVGPATVRNPLGVDDIEYYLANKVSSKLIASRISERGVNFVLTDKVKGRLKKAKADSRILRAISKAAAKNTRDGPGQLNRQE